ncbi:hypothetical protein PHISCL_08093 [Aspergillus sclerotialis]|uniref:PH domain-containing protein n=1 Tax=Aspergillus sclerotialis TaxID=2070753 RepID=A0A3A2Z8X9_9EURO|nr:hypothetical protein PHISCL_08093 [Aspergillus sclerotialis]
MYVCDMKFDTLQNGRGLCCYGCLYSWKLLFQEHDDNFELILSASSATEERQWKTEILKRTAVLSDITKPGPTDPRRYSFSSLDLAPLNRETHSAPSLARRSSMYSLGNPPVKSTLQHVVIKKTHCPNSTDEITRQVNGEIERPKLQSSQSPLILTTRRHDRIRLERFISDVYTRDVLPFPGMTLGKGDILLRPGAIIRKFSIRPAGFGRRSTSLSMPSHRVIATDAGSIEESTGIPDECSDKGSTIRYKGSEHSLDFERKDPTKLEDFPGALLARAKTVRLREVSQQISKPDFWSLGDGKDQSHSESNPWKSPLLQSIFSALGVRRVRRSRSRMGSGA